MSIVFLSAMPALAGQDLVQTVADGCKSELESYCKDVTPGEGRLLKCLEKNDKKVSARCKDALKEVGLR